MRIDGKNLLQIVQASLATALEKDIEIRPETRLRADLGVQSIDIIDFIFVLEKSAGVSIDLEDFFTFVSTRSNGRMTEIVVSEVVSYLEHKIEASKS